MKTAVIWGGTTTGKSIYARVKSQYHVLFFVDGNPALIGSNIDDKAIRPQEDIFEQNPDLVIMGILTGYEEAVDYLLGKGFPEERIITKYVDLNTRARIEALERVAQILGDKQVEGVAAELGVYRGDFAKEINRVFPERKLYLFDTFEGFPENALQDEEKNG